MDSLYNKIVNKQTLLPIDLFTTVGSDESLSKWIKLPFYQTSETILLDTFANEYTMNYIDIPAESFAALSTAQRPFFMNLKSIFSKDVHARGPQPTASYLQDKYLLELEYFSANAKAI